MSWEDVVEEIIDILKDELEDDQKERVYLKLIKLFEEEGCDNLADYQGIDPTFDEVLQNYYDDYDENEDYEEDE